MGLEFAVATWKEGDAMARQPQKQTMGRINRRAMLGAATTLIGGAVAGIGGKGFAAEAPRVAPAADPTTDSNLHPPVLQLKSGKLRGLREGRTFSFLGIPYADAERFELPKPVQPWDGVKNAQVFGPVCPIPGSPARRSASAWDRASPRRARRRACPTATAASAGRGSG